MRRVFKTMWEGPGGGKDVLQIAYPLVLGNLSFTLQTFVNRLFLTWYSPEALAGAVAGLFVSISLIGLFSVTGEYLTTFVAQYLGAGRPERVGPTIWQGIYFSALAGLFVALLSPLADPVFRAAGHAPGVMAYEITYTRLLMLGSFPLILMPTLTTFFAGRGETTVVLLVTLGVTAVNVVLDYLWIFGHMGFPRGGVSGAALATVTAESLGAVVFFALIVRKPMRALYNTLGGWRLEPELLLRILRFGIPSGLQFSVELLAFACFLIIVGRIGTIPLAASGVAFNLNGLVFVPMLGLGVGVSALVARYLGSGRADLAERSTWSALWMSLAYMGFCGALYVLCPRLLLAPFAAGGDPGAFRPVGDLTVVLLRFVALYSIFDMMNVVFSSALKGAGDTAFPLFVTIALALLAMLGPAYALCMLWGYGVVVAWLTATAYVVFLGLLMLWRFRLGGWKTLRVVEHQPGDLEGALRESV
jgi:MATE family multidrug resistance protein